MNIFKSKMTPAELAQIVGYQPQTINKWIKKHGWQTSQVKGVKGGKAHVIHMTPDVRHFMLSTRNLRQAADSSKAIPLSLVSVESPLMDDDFFSSQLMSVLFQMREEERRGLLALLAREGISGLLSRLAIS
ncbi:YfeC-like transcriptional regulator [Mangrovibacter yixingensis]|uniref:YfeC-like transcriptional regulator n=1 Tax=Mangrovibacter yixingensis TaxID=1529639 RepID=UPI001CFD95B6|nr:YfeC-like transcriptional regulator [Mangrovibacter yixingensis]